MLFNRPERRFKQARNRARTGVLRRADAPVLLIPRVDSICESGCALSGSTPSEVNKKDGQLSLTVLTCFGGPSGGQPALQAAAAALRALRAALANAHAFTQLRALSGSNPRRGNKKAAGIRQSLFHSMVGRQGFEPWTLGLKVHCSAS